MNIVLVNYHQISSTGCMMVYHLEILLPTVVSMYCCSSICKINAGTKITRTYSMCDVVLMITLIDNYKVLGKLGNIVAETLCFL